MGSYASLSVRPSVCHWIKIDISESIIDGVCNSTTAQLKYVPICLCLLLTTLREKFMSANGHGIFALTGRAHCQRQDSRYMYVHEAKKKKQKQKNSMFHRNIRGAETGHFQPILQPHSQYYFCPVCIDTGSLDFGKLQSPLVRSFALFIKSI